MFNKIKDLKEAWEQGVINLYPAEDKGTPGYFSVTGEEDTNSNVGFSYSIKDENTENWLNNRPNDKRFFSHAFFGIKVLLIHSRN